MPDYTALEGDNLPPWLLAYAIEVRDLFGLGDWYINVKLVRAPNDELENEGHARINMRYLSAHIELCESIPKDGLRHTLMHELLHVAFGPLELAHSRMRELAKEKHRDHLDELFHDGLEQTIERLTRALSRTIKPSAPPSSEPPGLASIAATDDAPVSPGPAIDAGAADAHGNADGK